MAPSPPKRPWLGLAVFLVLCFGVAALGSRGSDPQQPPPRLQYCGRSHLSPHVEKRRKPVLSGYRKRLWATYIVASRGRTVLDAFSTPARDPITMPHSLLPFVAGPLPRRAFLSSVGVGPKFFQAGGAGTLANPQRQSRCVTPLKSLHLACPHTA